MPILYGRRYSFFEKVRLWTCNLHVCYMLHTFPTALGLSPFVHCLSELLPNNGMFAILDRSTTFGTCLKCIISFSPCIQLVKVVHPACLMHFSIGIRNSSSEYTRSSVCLGVPLGWYNDPWEHWSLCARCAFELARWALSTTAVSWGVSIPTYLIDE